MSPKIFYTWREIPWQEPDDFFQSVADQEHRPRHNDKNEISFFINNPASPYPDQKEDEWSYVSSPGAKPLLEMHLHPSSEKQHVHEFFNSTLINDIIPPVKKSPSPFSGGVVGFLNYEMVDFFENIPLRKKEKPVAAQSVFFAPSSFVAFNKTQKRAYLYSASTDYAPSKRSHFPVKKSIKHPSPTPEEKFEDAVVKVKNYIASGDIFQANIARRWRIIKKSPSDALCGNRYCDEGKKIFLHLKKINPSPYACYIKYNRTEIISSSPELLVRRRGDTIETRPIAGTRPRGTTLKDDIKLSKALVLSPKERAEHIMLVDLERNDLGKICRHGTVRVAKPLVIEKYSHVQHIVSYIRGQAKKNTTPLEILKAMFPGGTITGCPKIRAIQIIDEVEDFPRGPYCGSAGWINGGNPPNDMEFNILIRTIIKTHNIFEFFAGAGIVADSKPSREFDETRHKALAMARSLGVEI